MMTGDPYKLPQNQRLRVRLDNFYRLAKDALCFIYGKEGFSNMCVVLCTELDDLCESLHGLESQYKGELPLFGEEAQNVCWAEEKMVIDALANQKMIIGDELRCFSLSVISRMKEASEIMGRLEKVMDAEYDPLVFANYGKRSLQEYNKVKWNPKRKEVLGKITVVSEIRQKDRCEALLQEYTEKLNGISDLILADNGEEIYYESLGRFIWYSLHTKTPDEAKVDELLCLVKTVEFLCGRMDRQLTFLDQETTADSRKGKRNEKDILREVTLQNQCAKALYRLGHLEQILPGGFTVEWIGKMLVDMVNSEHSEVVCHKMKDGKLVKFVHQIAGVLKRTNVLADCRNDDVVKALDYSSPKRESRIDYIRHMISDAKDLQEWLENYIADSKKRS